MSENRMKGTRAWVVVAGALSSMCAVGAQAARRNQSTEVRTSTANGVTTTVTTVTTQITENGRTRTSSTTTTTTRPANGTARVPATTTTASTATAASTPSATPTTAVTPTAPSAPLSALAAASVDAHNQARATLPGAHLPPMHWDEALGAKAAQWAQHLCGDGRRFTGLVHSAPDRAHPVGENLAMSASTEAGEVPAADAVAQWMEEAPFYDRASNQCSGGECGHYTQVMWRDSTAVGCGTATCPAGRGMTASVWVCNYSPAGNWDGRRPF